VAVTGLGDKDLHLLDLQRSARRWLARLHDELGAAGLAAASAVPGLCAALDQHAAAVRDATTIGMETSAAIAAVVLLAAYGRGLLGQARRHGWNPPPAHPSGWANADWISLRLAAVCALARQHPQSHPEPGPEHHRS
jgi:hypothetical protein